MGRPTDDGSSPGPSSAGVQEKFFGLGQFVGPGTPLGSVFAVDFAEVRLPLDARARASLGLPGELSKLVEIPPALDCRSSGYSFDSAPEAPLKVELR